MRHEPRKSHLPRELRLVDDDGLTASSAECHAAPPRIATAIRKIESLKIEPTVEFHRSSSGRNIRLKHSHASAIASPHGLTPRAPERKRSQDFVSYERTRSTSATSPFQRPQEEEDEERREREERDRAKYSAASPSNNQVDSAPKPAIRRASGKREDRRSSFMIPEDILEQFGYVRSSTPEKHRVSPNQLLEEKPSVLSHIEEEGVTESIQENQQQEPQENVYHFDLWKKAGRNRTLIDAISGYDSAPSPTKPSPPKPSPPKRRSVSADPVGIDKASQNVIEAARSLAGRHGFGRQHHSVDIATTSRRSDEDPELSLTRSTSPIIGAGSRSSSRSFSGLSASADQAIVRWRRGELLGEGTFGKVHMGLNTDTGELFALKEIEIRAATTNEQVRQLQKLSEEIELMHGLSHDHIVRYKGSQRTDKYFYIFMEYVPGGSIASMLKQFDAFSEELIRRFTRQIVDGVVFLHEKGIVHRDIKGANVLVSEQGVAKLADFGCSKQLPQIITTSLEESLRSIRGSIPWMAPEVVKQTGHGFKADIWSIGATVIEMATGKHPWPAMTNNISGMLMIATSNSSPPIPEHLSQEAKEFLANCFCIDPQARATAVELSQHPFLQPSQ